MELKELDVELRQEDVVKAKESGENIFVEFSDEFKELELGKGYVVRVGDNKGVMVRLKSIIGYIGSYNERKEIDKITVGIEGSKVTKLPLFDFQKEIQEKRPNEKELEEPKEVVFVGLEVLGDFPGKLEDNVHGMFV